MKPTIEAQVWRNTPPYPTITLYRAPCACGFVGEWFYYRQNAEREKAAHRHDPPRILSEGERPSERVWKVAG